MMKWKVIFRGEEFDVVWDEDTTPRLQAFPMILDQLAWTIETKTGAKGEGLFYFRNDMFVPGHEILDTGAAIFSFMKVAFGLGNVKFIEGTVPDFGPEMPDWAIP